MAVLLDTSLAMPELPEVETIRRALLPHLPGRRVERVVVRRRDLRWPVPRRIGRELSGARIREVRRRAKYLLLDTTAGTALIHLGMSGRLNLLPAGTPAGRHDHADILFDDGRALRLHDPRRFGCLLWTRRDTTLHPLLQGLGPEPLSEDWNGKTCYELSRHRTLAIKSFLMDGRVVVGIGNIYANEILHRAAVHPARPAGRMSKSRCATIADAVKQVLGEAIEVGGTTLRDFFSADGKPGLFRPRLAVYQRAGRGCPRCDTTIRARRLGQRSTFYCPRCQT